MAGVRMIVAACIAGYLLVVALIVVIFGGGADLGDLILGRAVRRYDEARWSRDERRMLALVERQRDEALLREWLAP